LRSNEEKRKKRAHWKEEHAKSGEKRPMEAGEIGVQTKFLSGRGTLETGKNQALERKRKDGGS